MVKYVGHDREELLHEAENALVQNGVVKEGDLIVLTIGEPIGKPGGTNTMKIVKVGENLNPGRISPHASSTWSACRGRRRVTPASSKKLFWWKKKPDCL